MHIITLKLDRNIYIIGLYYEQMYDHLSLLYFSIQILEQKETDLDTDKYQLWRWILLFYQSFYYIEIYILAYIYIYI